MIKFSPTLIDDRLQLLEWIQAESTHRDLVDLGDPFWWFTGQDCLVAGCIEDEHGPVLYFRLDRDGEFVRICVQFAPEDQVSKIRVIKTLSKAMIAWTFLAKEKGAEGLVFDSINPSLVKFMKRKFNFVDRADAINDYVLWFEEK
jgi:hypothetical protein